MSSKKPWRNVAYKRFKRNRRFRSGGIRRVGRLWKKNRCRQVLLLVVVVVVVVWERIGAGVGVEVEGEERGEGVGRIRPQGRERLRGERNEGMVLALRVMLGKVVVVEGLAVELIVVGEGGRRHDEVRTYDMWRKFSCLRVYEG